MARKSKESPIEGFVHLASLLPWWLALILAAASYAYLHSLAIAPPPPLNPLKPLDGFSARIFTTMLAQIGQWLIPFVLVVGAIVSVVKRRKRAALLETVNNSLSEDALHAMSWREFELLVGEGFRQRGYTVAEAGGAGPDGGVDLRLRKGGETFVVQCKQWRKMKVGVGVVRELLGVMAAEGAAGGFVVISGQFTKEAQAFAQGRRMELMDGPALRLFLAQTQKNAAAAKAPASAQAQTATIQRTEPSNPAPAQAVNVHNTVATVTPLYDPASTPKQNTDAEVGSLATADSFSPNSPSCPVCTEPMLQRTARQGPQRGNMFWGCSTFPACRGTRQLEKTVST